jgi:hypothetical protein
MAWACLLLQEGFAHEPIQTGILRHPPASLRNGTVQVHPERALLGVPRGEFIPREELSSASAVEKVRADKAVIFTHGAFPDRDSEGMAGESHIETISATVEPISVFRQILRSRAGLWSDRNSVSSQGKECVE